MRLDNYTPSQRNVVFRKVRPEKTKSGLFIPELDFSMKTHAEMFENEKIHEATDEMVDFVVEKVGPLCVETKVGDIIALAQGTKGQKMDFEDEDEIYSVMEAFIIGHCRKS